MEHVCKGLNVQTEPCVASLIKCLVNSVLLNTYIAYLCQLWTQIYILKFSKEILPDKTKTTGVFYQAQHDINSPLIGKKR